MTIYPTSAPLTDELLYKRETLEEVCLICEKLHLGRQLKGKCEYEQVNARFKAMFEVMTAVCHMEISIISGELKWERVLQELAVLLPQFAWVSCKREVKKHGRQRYYIEFVPIVYREEGFPFDIQLQASIQQQLFFPIKEAVKVLCREIEQQIAVKKLLDFQSVHRTEEKQSFQKEVRPKQLQFSDETASLENQLLVYKEEAKRSNYTKERMRIANERLELLIEKLEQTVIDSSISYLQKSEEKKNSKFLQISLREYSYLKQKARYLEKLWEINKELVKQAAETSAFENATVYKEEHLRPLKEMIFDSDIYMVMDECRAIDMRVLINQSPWFRSPYVKIAQPDYNSLVSKAAYFDLLQGENYFLRKIIDAQAIQPEKKQESKQEQFKKEEVFKKNYRVFGSS
ncbi:hypothetical protein A5888_001055 [Enterococcus sp. 9E7_DIV0242]|uniref:Uncharacterized protein n=1 Tax=Candidatus Enterococcus clewellii TaxID=1834193 RepID=A0A242KFC7_9ENTE|nr:hypothetical protein A5888_001065 [Enterococcus sp. 9E7_DIV0242]